MGFYLNKKINHLLLENKMFTTSVIAELVLAVCIFQILGVVSSEKTKQATPLVQPNCFKEVLLGKDAGYIQKKWSKQWICKETELLPSGNRSDVMMVLTFLYIENYSYENHQYYKITFPNGKELLTMTKIPQFYFFERPLCMSFSTNHQCKNKLASAMCSSGPYHTNGSYSVKIASRFARLFISYAFFDCESSGNTLASMQTASISEKKFTELHSLLSSLLHSILVICLLVLGLMATSIGFYMNGRRARNQLAKDLLKWKKDKHETSQSQQVECKNNLQLRRTSATDSTSSASAGLSNISKYVNTELNTESADKLEEHNTEEAPEKQSDSGLQSSISEYYKVSKTYGMVSNVLYEAELPQSIDDKIALSS